MHDEQISNSARNKVLKANRCKKRLARISPHRESCAGFARSTAAENNKLIS